MCGIIGYLGKKPAYPILIDGLRRMEYRGYDSAGIAIAEPDGIVLEKEAGRISVLEEATHKKEWQGAVGIGHIRWATHGVPNQINAHPHVDCGSQIFVVHNGIIENAEELRVELKKAGHIFKSETDTEIFAHLIEEQRKGKHKAASLEQAVNRALEKVRGAYGLAVLAADEPEKIVAVRFGSPLILGIVSDDQFVVASDVTALLSHTRNVIYLEDKDLVVLTPNGYTVRTLANEAVERRPEQIDWDISAAEKGNHPHFMKKEIFEQPATVQTSMQGRIIMQTGVAKFGGMEALGKQLDNIERLVIVACGTAYHAGMVAKYMFEEYAKIPVEVAYASELRYRQLIPDPKTTYLAISQSGETADTIGAMREAKRIGGLNLGLVNVVGSTLAREVDAGAYNHIGPEIAVASTKAFTSQLTILALMTVFFGRRRGMSVTQGKELLAALQDIPAALDAILDADAAIRTLAFQFAKSESMAVIGRRYQYPVALEGALKIKECSYIHAEGFPAGELKHGAIALIDKDFPTIGLVPQDSVYEKTMTNLEEIKARGGPIIAIASQGDKRIKHLTDYVISIPKTLEPLYPILTVIPLQLFAYYVAVARGMDVDKPRNLAKSVTVE